MTEFIAVIERRERRKKKKEQERDAALANR
jgi:hypothetical protein